ncbi:MAG: alginate export family protein [Fimbriimonas sp.]|nr:alginate export family protein [Fimbriimonas sp.]
MFFIFTPPPPSTTDSTSIVKVTVDLREQFQRHINPSFSDAAGKNRSDLFSRYRVGLDAKANAAWSGRIEYQYSHDLYWDQHSNGAVDASDLSLAYVKYSGPSVTAIGGRQKIELGDQRLIGSTEWLNLARSFDAARAMAGQWDAWAGRLGVANNKPQAVRVEGLSHSDRDWGTTSLILKHDLGTISGTDIQTLDHLAKVKVGKTMLFGEGAVQYGSSNGRDQRAWAYHLAVSQELLPKTTFSLENDAASGGGNATTSHTFDNLYPSNHNLYGLADMQGWKNMNHLGIRVENRSIPNLTLKASAHAFSLRDASDAWYNAVGAANPKAGGGTLSDPTGLSGRDIGKEFDLEAAYTVKHAGIFSGGIAFFEPGNFVQNVSGQSNQMIFGYLQYQIRF